MHNLSIIKIRTIILLVFLIGIHLSMDMLYRPFAYLHSIEDFGVKESFTQITSVIGISLLMVLFEKENTWKSKIGKVFLFLIPVVAMVIYEFIQLYIPDSRFDTQDLLYTGIGGVFAALIQIKVVRLYS